METIKRKPFMMHNPTEHGARWLFMLEADENIRKFAETLPCVQVVLGLNGDTCHVYIDTRYDYEEAWLWIYEQLENETRQVDLSEVWNVE